MIVSEKNISDALTYLADDPHPIAKGRFAVTLAENEANKIYSRLFLQAEGSIDARKATALCSPEHIAAKQVEADAVFEYERHKARVKAAEMLLEIWRTENANARAAERVR